MLTDTNPTIPTPTPAPDNRGGPSGQAGVGGLSLLDAALRYAEHGWYVFPLAEDSKEPITAHGHLGATTDAEQIHRWWTAHPTVSTIS